MTRLLPFCVIAACLVGCTPAPSTDAEPEPAEPRSATEKPAQLLTAEGSVVRVDEDAVTIEHDGIGDLWEPSEMSFPVKDTSLLSGVASGDRVRFWVAVLDDETFHVDMIEPL